MTGLKLSLSSKLQDLSTAAQNYYSLREIAAPATLRTIVIRHCPLKNVGSPGTTNALWSSWQDVIRPACMTHWKTPQTSSDNDQWWLHQEGPSMSGLCYGPNNRSRLSPWSKAIVCIPRKRNSVLLREPFQPLICLSLLRHLCSNP